MNRQKNPSLIVTCALLLVCAAPGLLRAQTATTGLFEDHGDVGTVLHPGALQYDPASGSYTISGSGAKHVVRRRTHSTLPGRKFPATFR